MKLSMIKYLFSFALLGGMGVSCSNVDELSGVQGGKEPVEPVLFKVSTRAYSGLSNLRILAFDTNDRLRCISNTGLIGQGNIADPMFFKTLTGTHHFYALANETESVAKKLMGVQYAMDSLSVLYNTYISTPLSREQLVGGSNGDTLLVGKVNNVTVEVNEGAVANLKVNGTAQDALNFKLERLLAKLSFVIAPAAGINSFEVKELKLDKVPVSATIAGLPTSEYNMAGEKITCNKVISTGNVYKGTLVIPEHIISTLNDSITAAITAVVDGTEKKYTLGLALSETNPANPTSGKYYNHNRNTEYQYNITVKKNEPVDVGVIINTWRNELIDIPVLGTYLELDDNQLRMPPTGGQLAFSTNAEKIEVDWSGAHDLTMLGYDGKNSAELIVKDLASSNLQFSWQTFPETDYEGKVIITAGNIKRAVSIKKIDGTIPIKIIKVTPAPGSIVPRDGCDVEIEVESSVKWYVVTNGVTTTKLPTETVFKGRIPAYLSDPGAVQGFIGIGYLSPLYHLFYVSYTYDYVPE